MGLSIVKMRTLEQAEEAGKRAAGAHSIAELRAMPTQEVAQNVTGVQAGVIVDGWMVPEDQSLTFMKGKQNDVDISAHGSGGQSPIRFPCHAQIEFSFLIRRLLRGSKSPFPLEKGS